MGVLVTLNDAIHAARDVTKMRTAGPDAFDSPEFGRLGRLQGGVAQFHRAPLRRHTAASAFDVAAIETLPRVDIVYGHAGATRVPIDAVVAAGARGIVNAGVGQGDVTPDVLEGLKAARRRGVHVVRASRVPGGTVVANGALPDDELDFVAADTLNPQKARILLMLALTARTSGARSSGSSTPTERSSRTPAAISRTNAAAGDRRRDRIRRAPGLR
jgi:L-asparaginase/glutamin-(asparagin-)ase